MKTGASFLLAAHAKSCFSAVGQNKTLQNSDMLGNSCFTLSRLYIQNPLSLKVPEVVATDLSSPLRPNRKMRLSLRYYANWMSTLVVYIQLPPRQRVPTPKGYHQIRHTVFYSQWKGTVQPALKDLVLPFICGWASFHPFPDPTLIYECSSYHRFFSQRTSQSFKEQISDKPASWSLSYTERRRLWAQSWGQRMSSVWPTALDPDNPLSCHHAHWKWERKPNTNLVKFRHRLLSFFFFVIFKEYQCNDWPPLFPHTTSYSKTVHFNWSPSFNIVIDLM